MSNTEESQPDSQQNTKKQTTYLMKLLMTGAMMVGAGLVGAECGKMIVPDDQEAKEALRSVLKDPEKTDKLIKAITNDPIISDDLLNDPRVMRNLTKLASAMIENSKRAPSGRTRPINQDDKVAGQRQKRQDSILEELFPHLRREREQERPIRPF